MKTQLLPYVDELKIRDSRRQLYDSDEVTQRLTVKIEAEFPEDWPLPDRLRWLAEQLTQQVTPRS